jgi:hypothetical protein
VSHSIRPSRRPGAAALVVALAAVLATPAFAQQPAPAPAPAAAAPAEPTPSHVAIAREVLIATGITRTFDGMVSQSLEQFKAGVLQTQPNLRADLDAAAAAVEQKMRAGEVVNMQISAGILLARRMSEAELKEVLTFFKSAAGQKYVEAQPRFLDDLVPAIDGWAAKALPEAINQVRAAMAVKGHKL